MSLLVAPTWSGYQRDGTMKVASATQKKPSKAVGRKPSNPPPVRPGDFDEHGKFTKDNSQRYTPGHDAPGPGRPAEDPSIRAARRCFVDQKGQKLFDRLERILDTSNNDVAVVNAAMRLFEMAVGKPAIMKESAGDGRPFQEIFMGVRRNPPAQPQAPAAPASMTQAAKTIGEQVAVRLGRSSSDLARVNQTAAPPPGTVDAKTGEPISDPMIDPETGERMEFADEDLDEPDPMIEAEIQANLRGETLRPPRPGGRPVRIHVAPPPKPPATKGRLLG